jgi:Ca2+-binding RTX toxin-like protein
MAINIDGKHGYESPARPLALVSGDAAFVLGEFDRASAASNGNGAIVVRTLNDNEDGDGSGVFANLYDNNGQLVHRDLKINTHIFGQQEHTDVTITASGEYAVSWISEGSIAYAVVNPMDGTVTEESSFPYEGLVRDVEILGLSNGNLMLAWAKPFTVTGRIINPDGDIQSADFTIKQTQVSSRRLEFIELAELDANQVLVGMTDRFEMGYIYSYDTTYAAAKIEDSSVSVVDYTIMQHDARVTGLFAFGDYILSAATVYASHIMSQRSEFVAFPKTGSQPTNILAIGNLEELFYSVLPNNSLFISEYGRESAYVVNNTASGHITISGESRTGSRITAEYDVSDLDGVREDTIVVNWFHGSVEILSDSSNSLVLTDDHSGAQIYATVSFTDDNGILEKIRSEPVVVGAVITGSDANDTLQGRIGDDIIDGAEGNDSINAESGNDRVNGGSGNDTILAGDGNDDIYGDEGNDTLNGQLGDDALNGGSGSDLLIGGDGDDFLQGGDGDDILSGGVGNDTLEGGADQDTAIMDIYSDDAMTVTGTADTLTISSSSGADVFRAIEIFRFRDVTLTLDDVLTLLDRGIVGTDENDVLTGNVGVDILRGLAGNDSLHGGEGNDTLFGGTGNDFVVGNPGDDVLVAGDGSDLVYGGPGNDSISGDEGDDEIWGHAGADTLSGGLGNDTLDGGEGTDVAIIGISSGADMIVSGPATEFTITSAMGTDLFREIESFQFTDMTLSLEELLDLRSRDLTGTTGADVLIGDYDNDILRGLDGNDRIEGVAGSDTIYAGDGADTVIGGDGYGFLFGGTTDADLRDLIYGGIGNDSIDGGYGNDELRGGGGNDTMLGGFGSDTIIGNAGDDLITGGAGSDLLIGGPGNDTLNGGWGYDRMTGGNGADRFFHVGVPDHASDWIQDYDAAEGDVLVFAQTNATRNQFQINVNTTPTAGASDVAEAFVIYRPTGQIMWALVDGDGQDSINIQLGSEVFDLRA